MFKNNVIAKGSGSKSAGGDFRVRVGPYLQPDTGPTADGPLTFLDPVSDELEVLALLFSKMRRLLVVDILEHRLD